MMWPDAHNMSLSRGQKEEDTEDAVLINTDGTGECCLLKLSGQLLCKRVWGHQT
jgi:hypothetical protein